MLSFNLLHRRGESLLEAVIAVFVVMTSITIALSVLTTNIDTTAANKEFLLADNLAIEAIEAGSNIIQTNYLRFGVDVDSNCWLVFPQADISNDQCDRALIIENGRGLHETFLVRKYENTNRGPQLRWDLSKEHLELDLSQGYDFNKNYRLYTGQLPNIGSTYYTQETTSTPSDYFRSIRFERVSSQTVNLIARVQWLHKGRVVTVTKRRTLTNG